MDLAQHAVEKGDECLVGLALRWSSVGPSLLIACQRPLFESPCSLEVGVSRRWARAPLLIGCRACVFALRRVGLRSGDA